MRIRHYKDSDFEQYLSIIKETKLYSNYITVRSNIKKKIEYDPESILVAVDGDKVIGFLFFIYDPWITYIWDTVVHKDYRNKGIASQLFQTAERIIKKRGGKIIRGFVSEKKPEILEFWRKRGSKDMCKLIHLEKKL